MNVAVETAEINTESCNEGRQLRDGDYVVRAIPDKTENTLQPTYHGNVAYWESATIVKIRNKVPVNSVDIIIIPLSPMAKGGGVIAGRVMENDGQKAETPAKDIDVSLEKSEQGDFKPVAQDTAGCYSFSDLPAGEYRIRLEIPGIKIPACDTTSNGIDTVQAPDFTVPKDAPNRIYSFAKEENKIKVYPNPTNGQLRITNYELRENTVIEIFDIYGRLVYTPPQPSKNTPPNLPKGEEQFPSFGGVRGGAVDGKGEVNIDISHLVNGIYFLKVDNKTVKIIKN